MKNNQKYRAILKINIDVFNLLESGECSGNRVQNNELNNYGLKDPMVVSVDGNNRHECLSKISNFINSLKGNR